MSLSPSTERAYREELARCSAYLKCPLEKATRGQIEEYFGHLESTPSVRGRPRSPGTIRRTHAALSSYYHSLVLGEIIPTSPILWVKAPEQRQLAPNIVKAPALIKIQAQALLEAETGIRDVPMLMVIMHGLKAGEVQRLNISDYDGQSLVVRKARSVRRILLSPITNQAMGFYLDWRESTISRLEQGAPLFISLSPRNYGSRLGYHGFYKKVKKISGLAGSPSVTPEHFRQTFASQLAAVEAQFLDAMDLMGYESPCSYRRFARHYSTPGATMAEVHSIAL